jgi:hypothetical protein
MLVAGSGEPVLGRRTLAGPSGSNMTSGMQAPGSAAPQRVAVRLLVKIDIRGTSF